MCTYLTSPGYRYGDLEVLQVSERCVRTLHHLGTGIDLEVLQVSGGVYVPYITWIQVWRPRSTTGIREVCTYLTSPGYRYGDLEVLQVSERCVRTLPRDSLVPGVGVSR